MTLPKWKWWQWTLAGFGVLVVLGSLNRCLNPGAYEAETAKADAAAAAEAASAKVLDNRRVRGDPFPTYTLLVRPGRSGEAVATEARRLCGDAAFCTVGGWADPALQAQGFPYTDREAAGLVFSYSVNRSTGFDRALWRCDLFPGTASDQCLAVD